MISIGERRLHRQVLPVLAARGLRKGREKPQMMISGLTYPSEIANANLNGHARAALVAARKIVGQPRNISWEAGINGARNEEDARVDNARLLRRIGGDAHGEADNHDAQEKDDEGASLAQSVREVRKDDGENGGRDVNGHSHELCGARGVAEALDNGGEEQADAVQRTDDLGRQVSVNCVCMARTLGAEKRLTPQYTKMLSQI